MSIQPTLRPDQQAWQCPTCEEVGRRGYCAPRQCLCGHDECHARDSYIPRRRQSLPENVTPLIHWKETG